jgi:proline dehydrogenase
MIGERERAVELNQPSPINDTIEDTHREFNKAIDYLTKAVSEATSPTKVQPLRFVVASHNQKSIEYACEKMKEHNIDAFEGTVAFAQLMGMKDATTFGLAAKGIKAYKVRCLYNDISTYRMDL